jgi:sensor histidine kinase YesM
LKDEIELAEKYLKIEKIRFNERLNYQIDLDNEAEKLLVPDLITQPIIENALKHGIKDKTDNALIKINATKNENVIKIIIEDNGKGFNESELSENNNGYGLRITKERIEKMFGEKGKLIIESKENLFTKITLILPVTMS